MGTARRPFDRFPPPREVANSPQALPPTEAHSDSPSRPRWVARFRRVDTVKKWINNKFSNGCASRASCPCFAPMIPEASSATRAFYEAGIGCIEYTTTMPDVLQLIREGLATLPRDLLLGVGTVMDGRGVEAAVAAGARFIASPGTSRSMIEACRRCDVLSIVGAMTPTEIMTAVEWGADVIKVFPAVSVGPGFFVDVLGPFPGLHLLAAGGMTLATVKEYVAAGVEIVAFLANGMEPAAYAAGDCPAITRTAARWVAAVARRATIAKRFRRVGGGDLIYARSAISPANSGTASRAAAIAWRRSASSCSGFFCSVPWMATLRISVKPMKPKIVRRYVS